MPKIETNVKIKYLKPRRVLIMTTMDKIKYCLHLWVYNHERFIPDFEVNYYKGLSGKNPHGIKDFYWQKAYGLFSKGITQLGNDKLSWLS